MENNQLSVFKGLGGNAAKILTALGIGAGAYAIYALSPFVYATCHNIFYAAAYIVGTIALTSIVLSEDFQRAWKTGFSVLCWKLTSIFVKMDPIHILKRGMSKMITKQITISNMIDKIQGIYTGMKQVLDETKKKFTDEKARLAEFEKRGLAKQVALSKNKIARYGTQIQNQTSRIEQTGKYLDVLKKLEEAVKFKVEDTENQVAVMEQEYEAALAQKEAISSIKSIMRGFGDSQEDMLASEIVWATVNESIGEIDRFLDGSNELLVNYGADQAVGAAKADAMIKEFEERGFESLTSSKQRIEAAISPEPEKIKIPATPIVKQNKYFN